jgi:hypothetical protein
MTTMMVVVNRNATKPCQHDRKPNWPIVHCRHSRHYPDVHAAPNQEVASIIYSIPIKYDQELAIQSLISSFRLIVYYRTHATLLASTAAPDRADNILPHILRFGLDALSATQWSGRAVRKQRVTCRGSRNDSPLCCLVLRAVDDTFQD